METAPKATTMNIVAGRGLENMGLQSNSQSSRIEMSKNSRRVCFSFNVIRDLSILCSKHIQVPAYLYSYMEKPSVLSMSTPIQPPDLASSNGSSLGNTAIQSQDSTSLLEDFVHHATKILRKMSDVVENWDNMVLDVDVRLKAQEGSAVELEQAAAQTNAIMDTNNQLRACFDGLRDSLGLLRSNSGEFHSAMQLIWKTLELLVQV